MTREEADDALIQLKKYIEGKQNTDKVEISVLALNRIIKALSQEPCDDAISRQYLLDNCVVDKVTMPYVPVSKIENAPPVTQKSGKWDNSCTCSVCGRWRILESEKNGGKYKYCPNCGAKMFEPQERSE